MYQHHLITHLLLIYRRLEARGIDSPTAVQMQSIPCILQGRDVIGLAATGSGKMLCYLLPLAARLWRQRITPTISPSPVNLQPIGLVMVPTRELMDQVRHELVSIAGYQQQETMLSFNVVAVCGGVALDQSLAQIRNCDRSKPSVVIATPGRLLHLVQMGAIRLDALVYLVLDEIDCMLDSGDMETQLRRILELSNETARQTLLWSATMPVFLERLARSAVVDPVTIRVGMGRAQSGAVNALQITQRVLFVPVSEKKTRFLVRVLRTQIPKPPVLVFCNSHESVDFVTRVLQREQFHVASLHGDKSQSYRFQVMTAFREGFVDVLVATDLASRGLNFADVEHVIQFDLPHSIEDYVHRCGRTARRSNESGTVTSFLTFECTIADELKRLLQDAKQPIPRELELPARFAHK